MSSHVLLPLLSCTLSVVFALLLVDQWRERRRPYQLAWAVGMGWYGIAAGTEFWGGAFGWSEPLYRVWYLTGAVYVAAWLGLGTILLLGRTRFGYAAAASLVLAGLFTFLSWRRAQYVDAAGTELAYPLIALVAAVATAWVTYRAPGHWARLVGALVVGGSVVAAPLVLLAPLDAPGFALDASGVPVGELMPGYARLLTPLFNVTGGFALALGALYSTYMFMPRRRLIRYDLVRSAGPVRLAANLLVAAGAIPVNLVASIPGTVTALIGGRLHSRVPATILLAVGGFVPSLTGGLSRFGLTESFYLGELLGVVFLFAGFLVSIEVFREIRVPFTRRVLRARQELASPRG